MESLWPDFEENIIEQNRSLQILKEQAREIKKKTNGKVNATFSKMEYRPGPTNRIAEVGQMLSAFSSSTYEEILDKELESKIDVNTLYRNIDYKFELYNDEYRFRLFVFHYSEMFPVSLKVDGGILEDVPYNNGTPISSNDELESVLREIFSSKKVRSVVGKMLQKGKTEE